MTLPVTGSTAHRVEFDTSRSINVARWDIGAIIVEEASVLTGSGPEKAIDFSTSSFWQSESGLITDQWIKVELTGLGLHTVEKVFIEAGSGSNGINNFEFRVSTTGTDDADFTTVLTGAVPQSSSGQEFTLTTPASARYVQLFAIDNHGHSTQLRVEQFKVLDGSAINVAQLEDGASIADFSSVATSNGGARAIHVSTRSFWSPPKYV